MCNTCIDKSNTSSETSQCFNFTKVCEFKQLIQSVGQRLIIGHKVAIAKWDTKLPIKDKKREDQVIESMIKLSKEKYDLDNSWVKQFFRDQIDASVSLQLNLHHDWKQVGHRPDGPTVDLKHEVRPVIDKLNTKLIQYSNQTKELRASDECLQLRDTLAKVVANELLMQTIDLRYFNTTLKHICKPITKQLQKND
ncbi:uncharacterized protein LOC128952452 [Oppia nitens]|uniref:uncharacterized protein LOC128952452 n=1 Tax=Oppia nitens TaxID=1686743 RepID=UPI0023DCAFB6|nr:uncharacterized protein LOC128952452 [Oppia nitens]